MRHAIRSEWTKAITLRSVQITVAAGLLVPPALAVASGLAFDPHAGLNADYPIASHGFETAGFGQPIVILLAALVTGHEYLDGALKTSLLATPQRGRVLGAKFILLALMSVAIAVFATAIAVVIKHAALGSNGLSPGEFTSGMAGNLLTVALNYCLISLLAAAITVLARTMIVTLVVLVPLVLGLTISLLALLPFLKYLPDLAGIQLLTGYPEIGLLAPLPGALVMTAWTAALMVASWLAFRRRDVGS